MSNATLTLLLLAGGTYVLKAAGPVLLGGDRALPPLVERLALLLPAALLAALVSTAAFVDGGQWSADARAVGLVAAAIALWGKQPFIVVILVAAAATAATRLLT